jgi:hypothetical protein
MINYINQKINPINIPSITDMGFREQYRKEMLSNKGYQMVRCQTEVTNDRGELRNLTSLFRVPNGESLNDFAKQYTKSEVTPTEVVRYFLEDKTLLSYNQDDMTLNYYDEKGELEGTIGGLESLDEAIKYYKLKTK